MGQMHELGASAERAVRVDLAAAFRLAVRMDLHEGVCNHFSAMLDDKRFLLNSYGLHWSEVTASNLVALDGQGNVLDGQGEIEKTAFYIHSRIHLANPRAKCVLHTHMPYATALTVAQGGRVEWVSQNALKFYGRIAYDARYNGLALDEQEGERMCGQLGDADILFLANHGVIVCGETVSATFDDLYYLERACMLQVLAAGTGKPLRKVPEEIAQLTARQMGRESQQADLHLQALRRILDREDPDWARC